MQGLGATADMFSCADCHWIVNLSPRLESKQGKWLLPGICTCHERACLDWKPVAQYLAVVLKSLRSSARSYMRSGCYIHGPQSSEQWSASKEVFAAAFQTTQEEHFELSHHEHCLPCGLPDSTLICRYFGCLQQRRLRMLQQGLSMA